MPESFRPSHASTAQPFFGRFQRSQEFNKQMLQRISNYSVRIAAILSQYRTPSQIAWGTAFGVVLGLIPKDNLIVLFLAVALAMFRVNQLAGCIVACALTLVGGLFEPLSHSVGSLLLQQSLVANAIRNIYQFPLLPWTCLDRTIVTGGIVLGLAAMPPTYVVCKLSFTRAMNEQESNDLTHIASDASSYRKTVHDQMTVRVERQVAALRVVSVAKSADSAIGDPSLTDPTTQAVRPSVHSRTKPHEFKVQSNNPTLQSSTHPKLYVAEANAASSDTILRETVIEVVRYRRPSIRSSVEPQKRTSDPSIISLSTGIPMAVANMSPTQSIEGNARKDLPIQNDLKGDMASISIESGHSNVQPTFREESLKYLLSHINGARESIRKSSGKSA